MSKEKQVNIKFDIQTGLELLQVLDNATVGYSKVHPPERIVRLRSVIEQLDKELEKAIAWPRKGFFNKYLKTSMYYSEWRKILQEILEKIKKKHTPKKTSDKDYEHYPMEIVWFINN